MKNKKPGAWFRHLSIAFGVFILACLVLAGASLAFLQTQTGKRAAAALICSMLSTDSFRLRLEGLEGNIPWSVRLGRFTLADTEGVWLLGENLKIDWSILDLFSRRLTFKSMALENATFYRPPRGAGMEKGETFSWRPLFPMVSVTAFRLDRLRLERPFAETPKEFRVRGEYDISPVHVKLDVAASRLDKAGDRYTLDARLEGAPARLAPDELVIKANIKEAPGGIIGEFIRLPKPASIKAALEGAGPVTGWNGTLAAVVEGMVALDSTIALSFGDETTLESRGAARVEQDVLPVKVFLFPGGKIDFDLAARLDKKNSLVLDHLSLDSGAAAFWLRGEIDLARGVLDGDFSLVAANVSSVAQMAGVTMKGERRLKGKIAGTLDKPAAHIETDLGPLSHGDVSMETARLKASLSPRTRLGAGFQGVATDGRLDISGLTTPWGKAAPGSLGIRFEASTEKLEKVNISALVLRGEPFLISASGGLAFETMDMDSKIRIEVSDLDWLKEISDHAPAGRGSLTAILRGNLSGMTMETVFDGAVSNLSGFPEQAAFLVGNEMLFSGKAAVRGKTVELRKFVAKGKSVLNAEGEFYLDKLEFDTRWEIDSAALPLLAARHGFEIINLSRIKGYAKGPFHGFYAGMEAGAGAVVVNGRALKNLVVNVDAENLPRVVKGAVRLTALADGQNLAAKTGFALERDRVALTGLRAKTPGASLAADLRVKPVPLIADGDILIAVDDFAPAGRYFDTDIAGAARLEVALFSHRGAQAASVKGETKNLSLHNISAGTISLTADIDDLRGFPDGRAAISLDSLRFGDFAIENASMSFHGKGRNAGVRATVKGAQNLPCDLKAGGDLTLHTGAWRLMMDSLGGACGSFPVKLAAPLAIAKTPESLTFENLDLAIANGRVSGHGGLAETAVSVYLLTENLDVSFLNMFIPAQVEGRAGAELEISGKPSEPQTRLSLNVKGLKAVSPEKVEASLGDLEMNVHVSRGMLSAGARFSGVGPEPGSVDIAFPLKMSLRPFAIAASPEGRVEGKIEGSLDLSLIPLILVLDDQIISGYARFDFSAEGTLAAVEASGTLSVSDSRYENVRTGTILKNIFVQVSVGGAELTIVKATATDGEKGEVTAKGSVALKPNQGFPFSFDLSLKEANLFRLDTFNASCTGSITLAGAIPRARLSGKTTLSPAYLTIPERLPPEMVDLDVMEINVPPSMRVSEKKPAKGRFILELDTIVELPGRFFVNGRGLDSEWKGAFNVGGTSLEPIVRGRLELIRGRYLFLDKRFNLVRGALSFEGSDPLDLLIDLTGEAAAKDVTAKVLLTGSADSPRVDITSDPPLPPDEILARLLFRRSLANISPLQALRLAQAINELKGNGGPSLDIMKKTRELTGVDEIDIYRSETGGTTLGVGKYIYDNVRLKAEKSSERGGDLLSIEAEITPNLSVESETGSDSKGGIGLNWKIDY